MIIMAKDWEGKQIDQWVSTHIRYEKKASDNILTLEDDYTKTIQTIYCDKKLTYRIMTHPKFIAKGEGKYLASRIIKEYKWY